jgi:hypothetical protein
MAEIFFLLYRYPFLFLRKKLFSFFYKPVKGKHSDVSEKNER